jgi:hypothetical protein
MLCNKDRFPILTLLSVDLYFSSFFSSLAKAMNIGGSNSSLTSTGGGGKRENKRDFSNGLLNAMY